MLKKVLFVVMICLGVMSVNAKSCSEISYKNIKDGAKLAYSDGVWSQKINKTCENYFIKKISDGTGSYSEFYTPAGEYLFSTGTQFEFIKNGRLIGYSNADLKFFEYTMNGTFVEQTELTEEEVQELFKDFSIVKISEFSKSTNSLKIKKTHKHFRLIVLNDTDKYFYHYTFTSGDAKYEQYNLKGFINIIRGGMIQFSHFGDNTLENPCFMLLVR